MRKIPQTCSPYSNHFCSELARLTWHCSVHNGEWGWGKRVLKMVCFQNSSHSFSGAEQCYRFEFLPLSLFPQLLIVKQAAVPPNPIGSGGHIRRQERSICSDWSAGGTSLCHLLQSMILFTFSPAHSIWPQGSVILNIFRVLSVICCFYFKVYLNTPSSRVWKTFMFSKWCPLLCCQLSLHLQPRTEKRYCL